MGLLSNPLHQLFGKSSRVGWEICMNPDFISHLSNHNLKPQRELGEFFSGLPQRPPAPTIFLPI